MRGAPRLGLASRPVEGIIPADAGSTLPFSVDMIARKDHPRGCGEHLFADEWLVGGSGSSPRMRGALTMAGSLPTCLGIIPADAGSTEPVGQIERRS